MCQYDALSEIEVYLSDIYRIDNVLINNFKETK